MATVSLSWVSSTSVSLSQSRTTLYMPLLSRVSSMAVSAIDSTTSIRVKPCCGLLRHFTLNPTDAAKGFIGFSINDFIGLQTEGKRLRLAQRRLQFVSRADIEARVFQNWLHVPVIVLQQREVHRSTLASRLAQAVAGQRGQPLAAGGESEQAAEHQTGDGQCDHDLEQREAALAAPVISL